MTLTFLLVLTALLALGLTYYLYQWLPKHGLTDWVTPRSSHTQPTPKGGGIAILVPSTVIGLGLAWLWPHPPLAVMMGLALVLAVVGFLDDKHALPVHIRLGVQAAVIAGALLMLPDLPNTWLHMLVKTVEDPISLRWIGWIFMVFLLIAGMWWINLFNFMDGIDGLASVQAMHMLFVAAAISLSACQGTCFSQPVWMLLLFVAVATLGFLVFNWAPAKIFMGDVGSTWLAYIIFALALLTVHAGWLSISVWLILAAVFVSDASVTLITRMLRGEKWHIAHCTHAYQRLARRWQGEGKSGHRSVALLVMAINLFWLSPLAWLSLNWSQWSLAWLILAYLPLVLGVVMVGAGQSEEDVSMVQSVLG